jgi:glycosyltransferase involved in cell wall biosynthesis
MKKLFSVLVPVYNRKDCIQETVDSVLAQTFTDYELIVIDDGSTDGTTDLLQSYGDKIKFIQQANQGPEVARNIGASQANGEYLALLDSDDLFYPCALATYDKVIQAFDSPAVIIGAMNYFQSGQNVPAIDCTDKIEVVRYRDFFSKDIALGISSSNIVIRKSVFDQAGGLRMSTPKTFHCDDYNLLFQTGTSGPLVVVMQPTTVAYRVHSTNAIHNIEAMINGLVALADAERNGKYPGGKARRIERYARIGGPVQLWVRNAVKGGRLGLAFRLLKNTWTMLLVCIAQKAWQGLLHRPIKSMFLPKDA